MKRGIKFIATAIMAAGFAAPADARVMLQYFEGRWETIEHRMPDIFMAGYGAMWLPPASRADSGDQSVGFDLFDRFDLGKEFSPTLYGTESSIRDMIEESKRAGILIYFDTVYNHNGFSDGYRDDNGGACQLNWAINSGGYPGFVMSGRDLPDTPVNTPFDMEFRNICPSAQFPSPSCDTDPTNCRTSNLIDINHDTDFRYIRHPTDPNNPQNIPYQANRVSASNARFYPDQDLASPYDDGVKPFDTANPLNGDATVENVNQMLQRYTQWMLEVNGVGGFRLDAVKHTPAGWFTNIYDFAAHNRGRDFWGRQTTPFSFGEYVSSNWDDLRPYHRKDGYGNRTVLDFPLKFSMNDNIGNPSGNFSSIIGASADGLDDNNTQNGTAGVLFVSSHDNGGTGSPPALQNVAYAHILSRKGFPLVYYNAREFLPTLGQRDFPNNDSRGDALGQFGSTITKLIAINNNFVNSRGGNDFNSLWGDADYISYELNNTLLVGLTDRDDQGANGLGYEERQITLPGFRSVRLTEVTGNATDATVDPNDAIRDFLDVPANGQVLFRVPTAKNANWVSHWKPYVMYTIAPPEGAITLVNKSSTLAADGASVPEAERRNSAVDVVTSDTAQIHFQVDQSGTHEDNALVKWDFGVDVDGDHTGEQGIALGIDSALLAGYENFTATHSPSVGGTGTYQVDVDLTNQAISEGFHYISAIAFVPRTPSSLPPIFNIIRKVIYVDRRGPDVNVAFPANPDGTSDIFSASYGFAVENADGTANAVHYFWNLPEGTNPITSGLLNAGNKAQKTDRKRFRFTLNNLQNGDNQKLTIVLFEETGNSTIQTFNIGVTVPVIDANPSAFLSY
ncbi:hypothetical protein BH09SUM1_BH09SUM1_08920 [soil metagenome]